MDYAALIGAGVGALGSYLGGNQAIDAQGRLVNLQEDAYLRALALLAEKDPEVAKAVAIGRPSGDTGAMLAQKDALAQLQEASRDGYSVVDDAAANRAIATANQNERGQREAILSRMDPRSGAAMAAQMQAQQSSANRASQQTMDQAANSRLKALQALGAYGNLAGNMREQEFNEASGIDKFNADVSRFNAGAANQANQFNRSSKLGALGLAGGAGSQLGSAIANRGLMQGQQTAGVGQALGSGIAALGSDDDDENKKGY